MASEATREPGAPGAEGTIPLAVPRLGGNEWAYLKECLDTNWVSSVGPFVDRFETDVAARAGGGHGVATTSGTAALHVALLVAGVEPDDEVVVPPLTFIAPANAVRYAGAWPVFLDVEPDYWQLDPRRLEAFLEDGCERRDGEVRNRETGRRVRAVLPVHALGHPVDMDPVLELARRHGLAVIEDAAESLGALYRDRPVGSLGDVGCFSFNGNKVITAGGGGVLVARDRALAKRARHLITQAKDDPVEYVHSEVGFNYRLTNIQAALGVAQLELLEEHVAAKRAQAAAYADALADVPGVTPMPEAPWAKAAFWLYTILVDEAEFGMDSRALLRSLDAAGIQTRPIWQPLHRSAAHAGSPRAQCPVADRLSRDALSLPSTPGLTEAELGRVIEAVRGAARGR